MTKAAMTPFLLTLGLGILAAAAGAPDAAAALLSSSQYFGTGVL
jgi:predicted Zn-dependent protease